MGASSALARRAFGDARTRTISFALLFGVVGAVQVVGYRTTYPTHADRVAFARTFGDNSAVRLFYGVPHDLLTVGGYSAWRVGGILSLFAAVWGLLAAIRAMRTEEDTGRQELVLALPVSRRQTVAASLAAIGAGALVLWLATFVGLAATRLPVGGSAYLALAVVSPVPVFVGVGALASQIAPNRRLALAMSFGVLAVAFALRVVADTATNAGWLRWATPLGWVEELRPFAGARPAVILLPLLSGLLLLALALPIALRRDIGAGLLHTTDAAEPRLFLLSSPTALALRGELGVAGRLVRRARRVRPDHRDHLGQLLIRAVEQAARRHREARRRVAADAIGRAELLLPLLRARDQPVRERADRRGTARGGGRTARDRARLPRRAAAAGSSGGCCWRRSAHSGSA